VACDVCATCPRTTVQSGIDATPSGGTVRICAGTYTRGIVSEEIARIAGKAITLVGAGAGPGGTVLDGEDTSSSTSLVSIASDASALLRGLLVTHARGRPAVDNDGELTLTAVTIADNVSLGTSGGGLRNDGTMVLDAGVIVSGNDSGNAAGGGIYNASTPAACNANLTLKAGARVSGNIVRDFGSQPAGGGIYNLCGGNVVSLESGSLVCDNTPDQCAGFSDPNDACQVICPS